MNKEFEAYGIELTKFLIENVSMPDDVKKEIFDYTRLDVIDLDKLSKFKAAKSIEIAANNDGMAGAGMGFAMTGMMGKMFTESEPSNKNSTKQESNANHVPPPIPGALIFYAVINGQQAGPYTMEVLQEMALQKKITKETLFWFPGMENWTMAGQLPELKHLFTIIPPQIPE